MNFPNANEILLSNKNVKEYSLTQTLLNQFEHLKKERSSFYLTESEFYEILKWKLRNQFHRQSKIRERNSDENIREITKLAFAISNPNADYEIELKIKLLSCLNGIGIPVASAILTLCFPEKYAVIDTINWSAIYNEKRTMFSIKHYLKYLKYLSQIAKNKKLSIQQVDFYIWGINQ